MRSLQRLADLSDRVTLITGGAGYIGFAGAEALAELGSHIILVDIVGSRGQSCADQLQKQYGIKSLYFDVDVEDEASLKEVSNRVKTTMGRLDVLIHSAALVGTNSLPGWTVPFEKQSVNTWKKALDINLTSVFILTQSCVSLLQNSGHGSIITINSIYGLVGPDMRLYDEILPSNPAAYAASKGGLLQLTRWFSTVLAPEVRSNSISLGGIFRNHTDPFLTRYQEKVPLKRMGKEDDVKGAIAYLASDLSSYVTGQNIIVDGGWTAW